VEIAGNLTVSGSLIASGTLVVNDNQAGIAVIPETGTSVTVVFNPPFLVTPIVTATSDDFAAWRIRKQVASGFTIELKDGAENDITFTWHAMGSRAPKVTMGEEGTDVRGITKFPVDVYGYPLSSSDIWNKCIRNQVPLDLDGQPFNCRRYHDEDLWMHPDLLVQFLWDPDSDPKLVLPENYRIVVIENEDKDDDTGNTTDGDDNEEETGTGSDDTGTGSTTDGGNDTGTGSTTGGDDSEEETGTGSTTGGNDTGTGSTTGGGDTGTGSTTTGGNDTGTGSTTNDEEKDSGTGSTAGNNDTGTGSTTGDSGDTGTGSTTESSE
jgi:hypothetical protein